MTTIICLSGSLRRASFNTALIKAVQGLASTDCRFELATLHGIPLYDGDLEDAQGVPDAVKKLNDLIYSADGLLVASPEYNNSIPGVLKNAVDWLSRPSGDSKAVFSDKPVALIGASTGGYGTILGQNAWLPVFRALGSRLYSGKLMVANANKVFDANGMLVDEAIKSRLNDIVQGFAKFCVESKGR